MKSLPVQKLGLPVVMLLLFSVALSAQEKSVNSRNQNQNPSYNYTYNYSNNHNYSYNYSGTRNPCKVFIGVVTSSLSRGLKVDETIDNTPATTYGVQVGDVILALDGVSVNTYSELVRERDKHQQGDAFTLTVVRNGSEMKINARFKECSEEDKEQYEQQQEEMEIRIEQHLEPLKNLGVLGQENFMKIEKTERPILGVYEDDEVNAQGLVIGSVIPGKGAEAAGLKQGDVVVQVDGQPVTGAGSLRRVLNSHRAGDKVVVVYERGGNTQETDLVLSVDRNYYSFKTERDPCAVFIGVYTSDAGLEGQGVTVTGVIDETPAKLGGVQPGDVILTLDGQPVNNHNELLRERNKHLPGDAFRLGIIRNGDFVGVDATFKTCPTDKPEVEQVQETVETPAKLPVEEREGPVNVESTLPLEALELYPNPTVGPLNVRFEAEAVPTVVRIFDATGKLVYENNLRQFNGQFNERIDLNGKTPGTYTLSIQQGQKKRAKNFVLMPRV